MSVFTYETALLAMQGNPAIQAITYSMKTCCDGTASLSLERKDDCIWHLCEFTQCDSSSPVLVWKRLIVPTVCFRGDLVEPLPAPCSPLVRQVATGYTSPVPQKPALRISLPTSTHSSPASGCLAPLPCLLSPLALSRQTSSSVEEHVTGIKENTHIFFDEDGNEISEEDYFHLELQLSPGSHRTRSFRHPRVLLFYLRYIAAANEIDPTGSPLSYPLLTVHDRARIQSFIRAHPPPPEFQEDVDELFALMELCRNH